MGVLHINQACSHLQNCARAHLGLTSIPNTKLNLMFALSLHRAGLLSSVTRAGPHPPEPEQLLTFETEPVTTANVATRRLWLGLKYANNQPLMWNVKSISTPKRNINATLSGLRRLARGFDHGYVDGLKVGESMFISTASGVLEIWEALEKKTGGLVLARTSPY